LLASVCRAAAATVLGRQEYGMESGDLVGRVVKACQAAIGAALSNPGEALAIAGCLQSAIATLNLVANETAKGEAGAWHVIENARGLTQGALASVLKYGEGILDANGIDVAPALASLSGNTVSPGPAPSAPASSGWLAGPLTTSSSARSCPLVCDKAIANGRFVDNQARVPWVFLDLCAKLADRDPEVLHVLQMSWPPDRGKKLPMGKNAASIAHQLQQQVIFFGCQAHRLSVKLDYAGGDVNAEAIHLVRLGLSIRLNQVSSKCGPDTGEQLCDTERLFDVIVSPHVERFDLLAL